MLIVALVLAAVGLTALVTAVVTSNEVLAFVCIAAAAVGVVLMIIDAIRDRHAGTLESGTGSDEGAGMQGSEPEGAAPDQPVGIEATSATGVAQGDVEAGAAEADPHATSVVGWESQKPAPTATVSLEEVATAAHHHPSAEETYEQFDIEDEEDGEPRSS